MKSTAGFLVLLLAFVVACDSFNYNPFQPDETEIEDQPEVKELISLRLGSMGGTIALKSGILVDIPPGALAETELITIKELDPDFFFESGGEKWVVVECSSEKNSFLKDVEIRIPKPEGISKIDSTTCLGGIIDDETGAVDVMQTSIDWTFSSPMLVIKTNHFSKYVGSFWQSPPISAGPLAVPYYNQGSSTYCWAVSIQMACEAVKPSLYEIFDIIGSLGYDESGISQYGLWANREVANLISDRTGYRPDRQLWVKGSAKAMDSYLRNRLALGFPVIVLSPVIEHVFLVVGYNGTDFIIHDPQSTNIDQIGYQTKRWADFKVGELELNAKFVTVSIPATIKNGYLNRVNMVNSSIYFVQPKTERVNSNIYRYAWDYTVNEGYSFKKNNGTGERVDTIPGAVSELNIDGIELSNADRVNASSLTVFISVTGLENDKISKMYYLDQAIDMAPNSLRNFKKKISVDDFRDKSGKVTKYQLSVDILNNGEVEDQSTIIFYLAPQEEVPELISLSPSKVKKGDELTINGKYFGEQQNQSKATLNGQEMAIKSWSAEQIICTVPSDATSGKVAVTVNNVKSNELYCEVIDDEENTAVYWPKAFICNELSAYVRVVCGDDEITSAASVLKDTIRGSNGVYQYSNTITTEEKRGYYNSDCESMINKEINEVSRSVKLTFKPSKDAADGQFGTVSMDISRIINNTLFAENGKTINTNESTRIVIENMPADWGHPTRPYISKRLMNNTDAHWAAQYISTTYSYRQEKCNGEVISNEGCGATKDNLKIFTFIMNMYEQ